MEHGDAIKKVLEDSSKTNEEVDIDKAVELIESMEKAIFNKELTKIVTQAEKDHAGHAGRPAKAYSKIKDAFDDFVDEFWKM